MGESIRHDIEQRMAGIEEPDLRLVFEPAWNQSMMSDAARL